MSGRTISCSAASLQSGEQLPGTAARADVWIVLEHPRPWGAKAFPESDIPARVKEQLSAFMDSTPNARVQLIKRRRRGRSAGMTFCLAVAHESRPRLYEFKLEAYEALLELDLAGLAAGEERYGAHLSREPLFLACTNGKRDPCCARFGLPVYRALRESAGDRVWQTSHVGGHRFAANVVCLPHGIYYGRVAPGEAGMLVEASFGGRIFLAKYRGRSCYPSVAQAAEGYLRELQGEDALAAYRLSGLAEIAPGRWEVRFRSSRERLVHKVRLAVTRSDFQNYPSCRSDKRAAVIWYELEGYTRSADLESG